MGRQMRGTRIVTTTSTEYEFNIDTDDDVVMVHGKTGVPTHLFLPSFPLIGETHLFYYYYDGTSEVWVYPSINPPKEVRFAGSSFTPGQGWDISSSAYPFCVIYYEAPWYYISGIGAATVYFSSGAQQFYIADGSGDFGNKGIQVGDKVTFTAGPNTGVSRVVASKSGTYLYLDGPTSGITTGSGQSYRVDYTQGLWWPIAK